MKHSIKGSDPGHIPALDGLRGWAILWVLMWHYLNFLKPILPGWAGVDLFFVLSGYLITGRLITTKQRPDYFSHFYRNRALRIFPLYFAILIAYFTIIHTFVRSQHLPTVVLYLDHWKSFFLFTGNWTFIIFGFPADGSLIPLWSIAVEEQFYLFWPLVIFLLPNAKTRIWFFTGGILLVLLTRITYCYFSPTGFLSYYNTFFRMDSLLAGSLLYQLHHSRIIIPPRILNGIAAALLSLFLAGYFTVKSTSPHNLFYSTAGFTLIALLSACLLHATVQPGNGFIPRFFNNGFLRFCGKISYGLYLFNFPILWMVGTKLFFWGIGRWPQQVALMHYLSSFICLLLTFLLSILSYRYFESWFLRLKNKKNIYLTS
jgi:peptidoglycan/LPS O-acetylase OafA/YrhL